MKMDNSNNLFCNERIQDLHDHKDDNYNYKYKNNEKVSERLSKASKDEENSDNDDNDDGSTLLFPVEGKFRNDNINHIKQVETEGEEILKGLSSESKESIYFQYIKEKETKMIQSYNENVQVLLNSPSSGLPSTILLPLKKLHKQSDRFNNNVEPLLCGNIKCQAFWSPYSHIFNKVSVNVNDKNLFKYTWKCNFCYSLTNSMIDKSLYTSLEEEIKRHTSDANNHTTDRRNNENFDKSHSCNNSFGSDIVNKGDRKREEKSCPIKMNVKEYNIPLSCFPSKEVSSAHFGMKETLPDKIHVEKNCRTIAHNTGSSKKSMTLPKEEKKQKILFLLIDDNIQNQEELNGLISSVEHMLESLTSKTLTKDEISKKNNNRPNVGYRIALMTFGSTVKIFKPSKDFEKFPHSPLSFQSELINGNGPLTKSKWSDVQSWGQEKGANQFTFPLFYEDKSSCGKREVQSTSTDIDENKNNNKTSSTKRISKFPIIEILQSLKNKGAFRFAQAEGSELGISFHSRERYLCRATEIVLLLNRTYQNKSISSHHNETDWKELNTVQENRIFVFLSGPPSPTYLAKVHKDSNKDKATKAGNRYPDSSFKKARPWSNLISSEAIALGEHLSQTRNSTLKTSKNLEFSISNFNYHVQPNLQIDIFVYGYPPFINISYLMAITNNNPRKIHIYPSTQILRNEVTSVGLRELFPQPKSKPIRDFENKDENTPNFADSTWDSPVSGFASDLVKLISEAPQNNFNEAVVQDEEEMYSSSSDSLISVRITPNANFHKHDKGDKTIVLGDTSSCKQVKIRKNRASFDNFHSEAIPHYFNLYFEKELQNKNKEKQYKDLSPSMYRPTNTKEESCTELNFKNCFFLWNMANSKNDRESKQLYIPLTLPNVVNHNVQSQSLSSEFLYIQIVYRSFTSPKCATNEINYGIATDKTTYYSKNYTSSKEYTAASITVISFKIDLNKYFVTQNLILRNRIRDNDSLGNLSFDYKKKLKQYNRPLSLRGYTSQKYFSFYTTHMLSLYIKIAACIALSDNDTSQLNNFDKSEENKYQRRNIGNENKERQESSFYQYPSLQNAMKISQKDGNTDLEQSIQNSRQYLYEIMQKILLHYLKICDGSNREIETNLNGLYPLKKIALKNSKVNENLLSLCGSDEWRKMLMTLYTFLQSHSAISYTPIAYEQRILQLFKIIYMPSDILLNVTFPKLYSTFPTSKISKIDVPILIPKFCKNEKHNFNKSSINPNTNNIDPREEGITLEHVINKVKQGISEEIRCQRIAPLISNHKLRMQTAEERSDVQIIESIEKTTSLMEGGLKNRSPPTFDTIFPPPPPPNQPLYQYGKTNESDQYISTLDKLFPFITIPDNILPSSLTQWYDNILLVDLFKKLVIVLPSKIDLAALGTCLSYSIDSLRVHDIKASSKEKNNLVDSRCGDNLSGLVCEIPSSLSLSLAIIISKAKAIQKSRFPTPSIIFCHDGDSLSRHYTHFFAPSHKDPEEFQTYLLPVLKTYFSKEEITLISQNAKDKFWYNNDKPGFVEILYKLFAALKTNQELLT